MVARRPPKMNAVMGTPAGSSAAASSTGLLAMGAVKRAFGCAAGRPQPGIHSLPVQSVSFAGGSFVIPSHQTSPSSVSATLVKMVSRSTHLMAFEFDSSEVPGATPK